MFVFDSFPAPSVTFYLIVLYSSDSISRGDTGHHPGRPAGEGRGANAPRNICPRPSPRGQHIWESKARQKENQIRRHASL